MQNQSWCSSCEACTSFNPDMLMQTPDSSLTTVPHATPAVDASAQQENLFAFIDSVMQQAVPPSADARAEAAVASASAPQDNPQSPAAAHDGHADVKTEYGILAERCNAHRTHGPCPWCHVCLVSVCQTMTI